MKLFLIILAFIAVLAGGWRLFEAATRDDPAQPPVTADGNAHTDVGINEENLTPLERAEQRLQQEQQVMEQRGELREQTQIVPLEQEAERLEQERVLFQEQERLQQEQQTSPYEIERRRLEEQQALIQQQQALIEEQNRLREMRQQQTVPMPETDIKPVTEF